MKGPIRPVLEFDLASFDSPSRLLVDAGLLLERDSPDKAVQFFEAASAIGSVEALYRLGKLLLRLNRPEEAVVALDKHFQLLPDHLDGIRSLAKALLEAGRHHFAEQLLTPVASEYPQDQSVQLLLMRALFAGEEWDRVWSIHGGGIEGNEARYMAAVAGTHLGKPDAALIATTLPPNFRRMFHKALTKSEEQVSG